MKIKISTGEKVFRVFNYIILTFLAILCLYPFWHVFMASFSGEVAIYTHQGLFLWPEDFSLDAYKQVLANDDLWSGYRNTFFLLLVGIPLDVLMTALGAYFLSRKGMLLKKPILFMFMFTRYFSGGTIPFYLNLRDLGLTETLWGVILPFLCTTYYILILRTAFVSIPESLYDAARIDGAGHVQSLFKIVLPLSKASLAVIAMYYGMSIWNGWFWSSAILRDEKQFPLQVVLRNMLIEDTSGINTDVKSLEALKYATIVISVIPVLILYPMLQKFFTKGVMIGAVKE